MNSWVLSPEQFHIQILDKLSGKGKYFRPNVHYHGQLQALKLTHEPGEEEGNYVQIPGIRQVAYSWIE